MGCAASKLENEDTVRRCKDRRRLMKDAVYARHHLAAAHSDYCRSLRLTGSALSTFAAGEPLSVSGNTPAVFLHTKPTTTTASAAIHHPVSPSPSLHPPPAPPFRPSPSPTIASSKLPHILSSSSIASNNNNHHPRRRKQPPPKLPHILSDSSPCSSPRSQSSNFPSNFFPTARSNYSNTPSQTSSVWNWENFYPPPPPPGSDYFPHSSQTEREEDEDEGEEEAASQFSYKTRKNENAREDLESERSEYDYFNAKLATENHHNQHQHHRHQHQHHHLPEEEYAETEREEVQCSEWGDHYSTTSSSDDGVEGDVDSRSEIGTRSNFGSESVVGDPVAPPPKKVYGTASSVGTGEVMEMKMVVRHKDLKEIVEAIKENFENAAKAGDEVSDMLEIGRAQIDRSFRQLRSKF